MTAIDAPGPIIRGAVTGGYHISDIVSLIGFVEVAKVPAIDSASSTANNIPLIPYEPLITFGIGLQTRFGGPKKAAGGRRAARERVRQDEHLQVDRSDRLRRALGRGDRRDRQAGRRREGDGEAQEHDHHRCHDDKGQYTVAKLPIGKTVDGKKNLDDTGAEISVDVGGKKPGKTTLTLNEGTNKAPAIKLEPVLPPGQLRGTVRNATSGRPIAGATVSVDPGGTSATTDADGRFTIDLAPGTYKATATAAGLATQQLDVTIEPDPNGAAVIKNFELRK